MFKRTIIADLVQGIIFGGVPAFFTATLIINAEIKAMQTVVNGWSVTMECGESGNGILLRAAYAKILPTANLAEEVHFQLNDDRRKHGADAIVAQHDYLRFPVDNSR